MWSSLMYSWPQTRISMANAMPYACGVVTMIRPPGREVLPQATEKSARVHEVLDDLRGDDHVEPVGILGGNVEILRVRGDHVPALGIQLLDSFLLVVDADKKRGDFFDLPVLPVGAAGGLIRVVDAAHVEDTLAAAAVEDELLFFGSESSHGGVPLYFPFTA